MAPRRGATGGSAAALRLPTCSARSAALDPSNAALGQQARGAATLKTLSIRMRAIKKMQKITKD